MICRKCGANIDTTIRVVDGSVQCHSCGTIYRPKNENVQSVSNIETPVNYAQPVIQEQQNNTQEQRRRRTAQDRPGQTRRSGSSHKPPFLKKKFLSLPIWAWLCAVLMIGGGVFAILASPRDNISANSQAIAQSPSQNVSNDSNLVFAQNTVPNTPVQDPIVGRWSNVSQSAFDYSIFYEFYDYGAFRIYICMYSANGYREEEYTNSTYTWKNLGNNTYVIESDYSGNIETTTLVYSPDDDILTLNGFNWAIRYFGEYTVLEYHDENTDYDVAHWETYSIFTGYEFSEGRAWVSFYMDNIVRYFAFINDSGEILYKFNPLDQGYISSNDMAFCPCKNGWTCFYEQSGVGNFRDGFCLLDKDGNEIFNSKKDNSSSYYFLGFGDDAIIYLKDTESFAESKSELFSMNQKGEIKFISYNRTDRYSKDIFTYLGDSIFARKVEIIKNNMYVYTTEIYNCITNSLFELDNVIQDPDNANRKYSPILTIPFYNGYSVDEYHGIPVSSSVLTDEITANTYFSKSNISISGFSRIEDKYYGEGLYYLSFKKGWVGLDGKLAVKIPSFPDTVGIDSVGSFSGGYALIVLRGADKKHYVTAINTKGEMQYEPVKVPSYQYNNSYGPTLEPDYYSNGNFFLNTSDNQILAYNGKLLNVNSDDLSIVGKESVFTIANGLISDGYILHRSTKTSITNYESLNHEQFIDYIYEYN